MANFLRGKYKVILPVQKDQLGLSMYGWMNGFYEYEDIVDVTSDSNGYLFLWRDDGNFGKHVVVMYPPGQYVRVEFVENKS